MGAGMIESMNDIIDEFEDIMNQQDKVEHYLKLVASYILQKKEISFNNPSYEAGLNAAHNCVYKALDKYREDNGILKPDYGTLTVTVIK
jgi:hypothetical protein